MTDINKYARVDYDNTYSGNTATMYAVIETVVIPEGYTIVDAFPPTIAALFETCPVYIDTSTNNRWKSKATVIGDNIWPDEIPVLPPEPEPPTESEWVQQIADRRYTAEVAGTIWGDFKLATDRESQGKVVMEITAISKDLRTENEGWKLYDSVTNHVVFRPTTNAEIGDIFETIFEYVRACFRREGVLLAKAAAGTMTATDLQAGWPATV